MRSSAYLQCVWYTYVCIIHNFISHPPYSTIVIRKNKTFTIFHKNIHIRWEPIKYFINSDRLCFAMKQIYVFILSISIITIGSFYCNRPKLAKIAFKKKKKVKKYSQIARFRRCKSTKLKLRCIRRRCASPTL